MTHYVRDSGFNQEKPTTVEGYIQRLIAIPKAQAAGIDAFMASGPIQCLVQIYGHPKIFELVEKNWPKKVP